MKTVEAAKAALAVALGAVSAWMGHVAPLVLCVACALVLDYITGMLAAAKEGDLSSSKGAKGIYKKLAFLCMLGLGFFLDYAIPFFAERGLSREMNFQLPFGLIIAAWIVLNESVSVLENLLRCGVRVPAFLVKTLKLASESLDKGEET